MPKVHGYMENEVVGSVEGMLDVLYDVNGSLSNQSI